MSSVHKRELPLKKVHCVVKKRILFLITGNLRANANRSLAGVVCKAGGETLPHGSHGHPVDFNNAKSESSFKKTIRVHLWKFGREPQSHKFDFYVKSRNPHQRESQSVG